MNFDLKHYIQQRRETVDRALDGYLPPTDQPPETLHCAMRYSLFCGGKRLRPILVLAGAEVGGGGESVAVPLACAVECIHTFSLIHDDLPAIDNDDLRRGQPTNHKVYGEAIAILAGDALLALAFELIERCRESAPSDAVLDVISMIAKASGTFGMVGGQVADIQSEHIDDISIEAVRAIHERKTGALLAASLLGGARLVGLSGAPYDALAEYGRQIGLAFQITDDLLDIEGDPELLGKPVGSDEKNDKATYPKVLGVDRSWQIARDATQAAISALTPFGPEADPLRALALYMVERDS
ncbi:MAG: polyprenyl synthetase family protein [Capsulimonadaceae bacterium]|nr:polyprenyl synthetase family protein [Capsulimonadaceae bacterium]